MWASRDDLDKRVEKAAMGNASIRNDQNPNLPDQEDTSSKHADACDGDNVSS